MNPSTKIINTSTPAIDIQTTLLVVFFDFPELDSFAAVGPSACLVGTRPDDGAPETSVPGGVVTGERGGGAGAIVELTLNGFPSFLQNKCHH